MNQNIPLFKIYHDKKDIEAVSRIIKSGMHWAEGQSIKEFESAIAGYTKSRHCVVFNSGTSALYAILLAYGIKSGDEVIVPSFTFIATANAPLFTGAKPVFADIEEETFGLDPQDVKKKITSRTKAIMPIHYGGCPCKIEQLRKIAKENNLRLIEDVAESMGARIKDKKAGTFGDAGMLSFCQNKIITTGEGGAIITDSAPLYEKLKLIRSHGRLDSGNYFSSHKPFDYITLGFNFRMPSFAAALGIAQLEKIEKIISLRRHNAWYLTGILNSRVKNLITPAPPKDYFHVYQLYTVTAGKERDRLMDYLAKKGIMTKVYFQPAHMTHFYRNIIKAKCSLSVTEEVSKKVLTLPMYSDLTKGQMDYIARTIVNFYREGKR